MGFPSRSALKIPTQLLHLEVPMQAMPRLSKKSGVGTIFSCVVCIPALPPTPSSKSTIGRC